MQQAQRRFKLQDKLWVDAGFWGGLVSTNAANHTILKGLLDAGALGFKSFMSPSGHSPSLLASQHGTHGTREAKSFVQKSGRTPVIADYASCPGIVDFGSVDRGHIAAALPFLKAEGVPYYVHAELPDDKKFEASFLLPGTCWSSACNVLLHHA